MSPSEFQRIFQETVHAVALLANVKSGEYAPVETDRLSNFKEAGKRQALIPEKVLMVYLDKHFSAVSNYVNDLSLGRTRPRSEGIQGRVDDFILYGILLKCLIAERADVAEAIHEEDVRLQWEDS